jgi:hypothetical protein
MITMLLLYAQLLSNLHLDNSPSPKTRAYSSKSCLGCLLTLSLFWESKVSMYTGYGSALLLVSFSLPVLSPRHER